MSNKLVAYRNGEIVYVGDYVLDQYGERVYSGDYVEVLRSSPHFAVGKRRRVQRIDAEKREIQLNVDSSRDRERIVPERMWIGAGSVRICGRYHPAHSNRGCVPKEKEMLHIAIRIDHLGEEWIDQAVKKVNSEEGDRHGYCFADRSQQALKNRLEARIRTNPEERWLILSGNTIAETATPPVRFRSV